MHTKFHSSTKTSRFIQLLLWSRWNVLLPTFWARILSILTIETNKLSRHPRLWTRLLSPYSFVLKELAHRDPFHLRTCWAWVREGRRHSMQRDNGSNESLFHNWVITSNLRLRIWNTYVTENLTRQFVNIKIFIRMKMYSGIM
jgi:hypothetical protein